ncbi:MAG: endonuclease [Muribaculaceae bacterium]|nr:endonuclease [Muribaculaceae bacterium]
MKRITKFGLCIYAILFAVSASAEIPQGYYNNAEGTKREKLKSALCKIIKPSKVLKYGGKSEGYTWEGFTKTDVAENGSVLDRYSNEIRRFNGINAVSGMHIEHSFANSWWGGINNDAYKDLHHLYPADASANMSKSNHPIGIVTEPGGFDNGVTKTGLSNCFRADTLIKVWEPADIYKGDFARTYMYMATCYEDYTKLWTSNDGLLMIEKDTYPLLRPWVVDLLIQWNRQDPVSVLEQQRNENVYAIQGNRNPFIDYPQLAEYIWGDKTDSYFYTEVSSDSKLYIPSDNSTLDFGLQALSLGAKKELNIRGINLTENLTISISNNNFTIDKTILTPDEVKSGRIINISSKPASAGAINAIITLSSGAISNKVYITAEFIDGLPAFEATEISCANFSKSFVASWLPIPGETQYSLDVYTKKGETKTSIAGYPKTIKDTSAKVTVTEAETTYYYTVSSSTLTSNEITVLMPSVPPVFSVNRNDAQFFSRPGLVSFPQIITMETSGLSSDVYEIVAESPFELSNDETVWSDKLTITGKNQSFFIRLGKIANEGTCEGEAIISAPGAEDVIINLKADVSYQRAFFENFEIGTKSSYALKNVKCTSAEWAMNNALIGSIANDKRNNEKSARIKGEGSIYTVNANADGLGKISFYAGSYGTDSGMSLKLEYSIDNGITWTPIISELPLATKKWKKYEYEPRIDGYVMLKFTAIGSASKRVNVDDIQYMDYKTISSAEATVADNKSTVTATGSTIAITTSEDATATIFDSKGTTIMTRNIKAGKSTINCNTPPGCYIVKLGNDTHKLILK